MFELVTVLIAFLVASTLCCLEATKYEDKIKSALTTLDNLCPNDPGCFSSKQRYYDSRKLAIFFNVAAYVSMVYSIDYLFKILSLLK